MSWDKNTVDCSRLDTYKAILDELGLPYELTVKIAVRGMGLNDDEDTVYELRRLQYNNFVILERMERTSDCDTDDVITSTQFLLEDEPKDWQYEIMEENS